jgi:hypothetical protein
MDNDTFYRNIGHALSSCQLLEYKLKRYIADSLDFIRGRLDNRITFKMDGTEYKDASLERLISTFGKLTTNDALVKQLGKFKDRRNDLSHRGATDYIDLHGVLNFSIADKYQPELDALILDAERLCRAVIEEGEKIQWCVASDFDDVSKEQ